MKQFFSDSIVVYGSIEYRVQQDSIPVIFLEVIIGVLNPTLASGPPQKTVRTNPGAVALA
jgi:hypothetical protein